MKVLLSFLITILLVPDSLLSQKLSISSAISPLSTNISQLTYTPIPNLSTNRELDNFMEFSMRKDSTNYFSLVTPSKHILPNHVRENPAGYSFLCKLEVDIEENSPIPFWFQLGNNDKLFPAGSAHVKLKMFKF